MQAVHVLVPHGWLLLLSTPACSGVAQGPSSRHSCTMQMTADVVLRACHVTVHEHAVAVQAPAARDMAAVHVQHGIWYGTKYAHTVILQQTWAMCACSDACMCSAGRQQGSAQVQQTRAKGSVPCSESRICFCCVAVYRILPHVRASASSCPSSISCIICIVCSVIADDSSSELALALAPQRCNKLSQGNKAALKFAGGVIDWGHLSAEDKKFGGGKYDMLPADGDPVPGALGNAKVRSTAMRLYLLLASLFGVSVEGKGTCTAACERI